MKDMHLDLGLEDICFLYAADDPASAEHSFTCQGLITMEVGSAGEMASLSLGALRVRAVKVGR